MQEMKTFSGLRFWTGVTHLLSLETHYLEEMLFNCASPIVVETEPACCSKLGQWWEESKNFWMSYCVLPGRIYGVQQIAFISLVFALKGIALNRCRTDCKVMLMPFCCVVNWWNLLVIDKLMIPFSRRLHFK